MINSRIFWFALLVLALAPSAAACQDRTPPDTVITLPVLTPVATPEATATLPPPLPLAARFQDPTQSPRYLDLEMVWASDEIATVEQPAFYKGQLVGLNVRGVWRVAGGYEAEGRRRLLWFEPQGDGAALTASGEEWRDGLHQLTGIWPATGLSVTDGATTDLVLFHSAPESTAVAVVEGQLLRAGEDRPLLTELRCDTGQTGQWTIVDGSSGQPFRPQADDSLQLMRHYLADDGSVLTGPGAVFSLGDEAAIRCELQPLPGGTYFAGWVAEDEDGLGALVSADFAVGALEPDEILQTYLDPEAGFQFHYPSDWSSMRVEDHSRIASNPVGTTELSITLRPNALGMSNEELKNQVLAAYGPVEVLYETEVTLAGMQASWTAYGYEAGDGLHTGVLVTFIRDGTGYAVDVDGPAAEEEAILDTMGLVTGGWRFRVQHRSVASQRWKLAPGDGLVVAVPAEYGEVTDRAGWEAFRSIVTGGFLAVRPAPASSGTPASSLGDWLGALHPGVAELAVSESYPFSLGRRSWTRADYAYRSSGGAPVWGLLMITEEDEQPLFFWAEAPAAAYQDLEEQVFLPAAGSLHLSD